MQEYKLVLRAIHGGATVRNGNEVLLQNASEFQDYLSETYLENGYRVLSVDYLGEFVLDPENSKMSAQGPRFAYHMVKDVK